MKFVIATTGAAAVALTAGFAAANGHSEKCFDKGTLTYFDCPVAEEMAPEHGGFYIGARGGAAWVDSQWQLDAATAVDQEYEVGGIITGMFGYEYVDVLPGVSLRPELEVGYLAGGVEEHAPNGAAVTGDSGDTSALFGFVNLFVDLEITDPVDLIVGGGVGYGQVTFDDHAYGGTTRMDDDDGGFAYNLGGGLAYEFTQNVELELMYRYFNFNVDATSVTPYSDDTEAEAHTGTIGLRYEF